MHAIITHENSDFDALASSVAARLLYPDAEVWLPRRVSQAVRDFLALHRDHFRVHRFDPARAGEVDRLTIVDVRRRRRLEHTYGPLLARVDEPSHPVWLELIDHHRATHDDLEGDSEQIERVGSATTLLVERLAEAGATPDPPEATLFALGVHTDTGSLTLPGSTARDAAAVAWIMEHGANLEVLRRYLDAPYDARQRATMAATLEGVTVYEIGSVKVGFAVVDSERNVPDLGSLVSHALRFFEECAALIGIYPSNGRGSFVIARSRVPWIDVGHLLEGVGGGGHSGAAAARVKDVAPEALVERLLAALREDPPTPRTVADLMSSPVRTIHRDAKLSELARRLSRESITGLPVVDDDGAMVGVVSRRDLNRADPDSLDRLPVAGCMAHNLATTTMETSLEDALAAMTARDIGRLPVLRRGRLVGIVTRTDLLSSLYGGSGQRGSGQGDEDGAA